jgi:uncharacterized membrane protein
MLQEHRVFIVSLILKGANALLEIAAGIALIFYGQTTHLIEYFIRKELLEDPSDMLANLSQHYLPSLSVHSQMFLAFYFLSHGIIKLSLVGGLLMKRHWAYPTAIVVFALFMLYQMYRYALTHSMLLIVLTIFDALVIWLTWIEYKRVRSTA